MYVETLNLIDFRNYERLAFNPSPGLNVIYGGNAQGKSSLLEALYMLATSKSHRTSRDLDVVRVGAQACGINARVVRPKSSDVTVEMLMSRSEKKTVRINTVRHSRMTDLIGQLNAVIFSALDIEMVRGEPDLRRRFLNLEISQVSPQYVFNIGRYKRAINQRNNLLKEIGAGTSSPAALEVWDSQVASYGAAIIARRKAFCSSLAALAADIYAFLTDCAERLDVDYKSSPDVGEQRDEQEIAESYGRILRSRREVDMARATTTSGPHRDDLVFSVSGLDARHYGSQGQQKTAALSVKLAELELIEQTAGESPVVLLDDATAELDETRRTRVIERVVDRCQTLITTTRPEELGSDLLRRAAMYRASAGSVGRQ